MANGEATLARLWSWTQQAREIDWDAAFAEALPRVYNFLRYRVGDGPLAEDLTSVTFEKAWRAREQYRRDRAAIGTWLFAVARNVAVDHFRSLRPTVPLEEAEEGPQRIERRHDPPPCGGGASRRLGPRSLTMDDRMLHEYRREPDPRFASDLRERLRRHERPRALLSPRATRIVAAVAAAAAVTVVFAVPSVRVSAQALLDVFRVKRFAAVEFQESRRELLASMEKGRGFMIFDRQEKILDPGPATHVASREAAAAQAGFAVSVPGYLPDSLVADSLFIQGEGAMRMAVSEARLRSLLGRLDLDDVKVPAGLDGQWIEIRKPPVVMQRFRSEKRRVMLLQARSPEVKLPAGWNLEQLGEIGLRILGLDPGEARRIAKATDWRNTLLVPLPMNAATFRQVTVRGQSGLLITTTAEPTADGNGNRMLAIVMWSEGDRVFCLQGDLSAQDLMQMAESVS